MTNESTTLSFVDGLRVPFEATGTWKPVQDVVAEVRTPTHDEIGEYEMRNCAEPFYVLS